MKPHELENMRKAGFLKIPETNETTDEVLRWYFSTVEARDIDYMNGLIKKLTWENVKSLVGYEPTWIATRDLAKYCFIADNEYISHCSNLKKSDS